MEEKKKPNNFMAISTNHDRIYHIYNLFLFFFFFYFYSFWIKEILSSLTSAESLSPCCTGNYEEL